MSKFKPSPRSYPARRSSPESSSVALDSSVALQDAPAVEAPVEDVQVPDSTSPARQLAFKIALAMVFLQFSFIHQTLAAILHINLYLMYLVGVPAILGLLLSGSLKRSFGGRPVVYFCGYAIWMLIALPFSTWRGGSLPYVMDYFRTSLPPMLLVAGLTLTWRECRMVMSTVALGAVVDLFTARFFANSGHGEARLGIQSGTVANPNDFAGHLILALSFLLWVGLSSSYKLMRLFALLGVGVGIVVIFKTGSRGAEIGLAMAMLTFFMRARTPQRIALMILGPAALIMLPFVLPPETLQRLESFSITPDSASSAGKEARRIPHESRISVTDEYQIHIGISALRAWPGPVQHIRGLEQQDWGSNSRELA